MLLTFVVSCHALKTPVAVNLGRLCLVSVRGHLGCCCAEVTLKGACESIQCLNACMPRQVACRRLKRCCKATGTLAATAACLQESVWLEVGVMPRLLLTCRGKSRACKSSICLLSGSQHTGCCCSSCVVWRCVSLRLQENVWRLAGSLQELIRALQELAGKCACGLQCVHALRVAVG